MTDSFNDLIILILTIILVYVFYNKMCKRKLPSIVAVSNNVNVKPIAQLLDINSNTVNNNPVVSNLEQNEIQHQEQHQEQHQVQHQNTNTNASMPYVMPDDDLDMSDNYHDITLPTTIMHGEQKIDEELVKEPSNFNYTKIFSKDFDYYTPDQLYPAFE